MNRLLAASLACTLLFTWSALAQEKPNEAKDTKDPKDTFEIVLKDWVAGIKGATENLKTAKDEKSAKDAKTALAKSSEDWQKVQQRMQKLGQPTKEQEQDLEKKFKSEIEAAVKSFQTEAERLSKETWGKDVLEALKPKAAEKPKGPTPPPPPKKD